MYIDHGIPRSKVLPLESLSDPFDVLFGAPSSRATPPSSESEKLSKLSSGSGRGAGRGIVASTLGFLALPSNLPFPPGAAFLFLSPEKVLAAISLD